MDYSPVLESLRKFAPLTSEEADYFSKFLKIKRFKKKQFLIQAKEPCRFDFFIVSGLVREYFTDLSGKEFVFRFVKENEWTSDYESFLSGNPASLTIEALEDLVVFSIYQEDANMLLETFPAFERSFRIYLQKSYSSLQHRLFESLSNTVEQRYEEFVFRFPDLAQRVPQYQIAAYLGVSPEFLSKIRQRRGGVV
ncbi:Crp/Fnr family transcriptional regulator [Algoriphagus lacus]|uniref:Crp/Fnr family transcriptional regulator n=1 Tax=Algoriphagus lacus TaxID=2056311 RepID=A0A418PNG2_9BACT|nr:Crp/Fnr family transcriptional regulator [Algoriphagus lacus]RIW13368.1 Crp/Fnr family transcriptional regulator [Algoriphagus lacus]